MPEDGSNLPIPNQERNHGGELEVYHCRHQLNGAHPWRRLLSNDEENPDKPGWSRHQPPSHERKVLNLSLPIFILFCALLAVIATLIIITGLLSSKIAHLENTLPSLVHTIPSNDNKNHTNAITINPALPTTSLAPPTILVSGWTYLGCYYDSRARMLSDASVTQRNMTNAVCADFCTAAGAGARPRQPKHFGTQNAGQCFCGSVTDTVLESRLAPDWMCNHQCKGRTGMAELCGGDWVLSLWERIES